MNAHINFIEQIYENVKAPLGFICNRIKYFMGYNSNYSLTYSGDDKINYLKNDSNLSPESDKKIENNCNDYEFEY